MFPVATDRISIADKKTRNSVKLGKREKKKYDF